MAESVDVRMSRLEAWREEIVHPRLGDLQTGLDALEVWKAEVEARNWKWLGVLGGLTFVVNAAALLLGLFWAVFGDTVRDAML